MVDSFQARRRRRKSTFIRNIPRHFVDGIVVLIVIGLAVLLRLISPKRTAFLCDDANISYPNVPETISESVLHVFGTVVPFTIFYVVELASESNRAHRSYLRLSLTQVCRMTAIYIFGMAVTMVFVGTGKVFIGELRPNFLQLCKPNISHCEAGQYMSEYICTSGAPRWELNEAYKGFPSLHSACSAYSMVFVTLYMQARLKITFCSLLRPLLQALGLGTAYYFAITRVTDYKHHWSDCLCGSLLGVVIAIYTACHVANLFVVKHIPTTSTLASLSDSEYDEREQFLRQTSHLMSDSSVQEPAVTQVLVQLETDKNR